MDYQVWEETLDRADLSQELQDHLKDCLSRLKAQALQGVERCPADKLIEVQAHLKALSSLEGLFTEQIQGGKLVEKQIAAAKKQVVKRGRKRIIKD